MVPRSTSCFCVEAHELIPYKVAPFSTSSCRTPDAVTRGGTVEERIRSSVAVVRKKAATRASRRITLHTIRPSCLRDSGFEVFTGAFALGSSADGAVISLRARASALDTEVGLALETRGLLHILPRALTGGRTRSLPFADGG